MKSFFNNSIGRLRLIGFLEGTSLLLLVLLAVPFKHFAGDPGLVKTIGPVHGALFLLFVFQAISVSIEQGWSFQTRAWKILLACLVPFGTFYVDRKILKGLHDEGLRITEKTQR
jgi:integral membrane protein